MIVCEVEDEEILEAVKSDFKLANITWFERNFDPEKNKHLRGKTLGNVFNEVIAIEEDDTMTLAEKEQAIESLFQETVDAYENINFNHVNQFAVGTLQRRTAKFRKGALYNVLDKRDQFNASNFLEAGLAIDKDNEIHEHNEDNNIGMIFFSVFGNWFNDTRISMNDKIDSTNPKLIFTDNILHAAWIDQFGDYGKIMYSKSTDNGSTWTSQFELATISPKYYDEWLGQYFYSPLNFIGEGIFPSTIFF